MTNNTFCQQRIASALNDWTRYLVAAAATRFSISGSRGCLLLFAGVDDQTGQVSADSLYYLVPADEPGGGWQQPEDEAFAERFEVELRLLSRYVLEYDPSASAVVWLWNGDSFSAHLITDYARRN